MTYRTFDGTSQSETIVDGRFSSDGSQYIMDSPEKLNIGTGKDLSLYHNGTDSIIESNTNDLILNSQAGDDIFLKSGDDIFLKGKHDGLERACADFYGNAGVVLYHGGYSKFQTTSDGTKTTGAHQIQQAGAVSIQVGSTNAGGATVFLDGDSNGDWSGADYAYIQHDTSGDLLLVANNPADDAEFKVFVADGDTLALTISDSAAATFSGNVKMAASKGIQFSAYDESTGDGNNISSNTLDDYEEGIWTPTIANGGWTSLGSGAVGHYTRVGNIVHIQIVNGVLTGSGNSNTLQIGGLPFTVANWTPGSMYAENYNSEGTDQATIVASGAEGLNTQLRVVEWGVEAIGTDFGAGYFVVQITYRTTD